MPKKIKTIKRHEHLPTPYHVNAMAEINGQSDRGTAIAGTAYLDLLLRHAIERCIRSIVRLQDELFENRGPLQEFSARIHIAFAFRVIGPGAYTDLLILRDIRNAFAHSADAFGFDREDIANLCDHLWYPHFIMYHGIPAPTTPRGWFIRGVELLADGLMDPIPKEGFIPLPNSFIQQGPHWPPPQPQASRRKPRERVSRGRPTPS